MSLWVIFQEIDILPEILKNVFISAFSGHAAIGGFAGSSALLAIQHGISRADIHQILGLATIQSFKANQIPFIRERQARLAVLGSVIDNLVCTMSILVVLLSGMWEIDRAFRGVACLCKLL